MPGSTMFEIPRREIQRTGGPINHAMHRSGCIVRERRIKGLAFSDSAIRRLALLTQDDTQDLVLNLNA